MHCSAVTWLVNWNPAWMGRKKRCPSHSPACYTTRCSITGYSLERNSSSDLTNCSFRLSLGVTTPGHLANSPSSPPFSPCYSQVEETRHFDPHEWFRSGGTLWWNVQLLYKFLLHKRHWFFSISWCRSGRSSSWSGRIDECLKSIILKCTEMPKATFTLQGSLYIFLPKSIAPCTVYESHASLTAAKTLYLRDTPSLHQR